MVTNNNGSLIVVGTGINVVSQTTISAQSHIQCADVVYTAVCGVVASKWIESLNENVVALSGFYQQGKPKAQSYAEIIEVISRSVQSGKKVCAAFYGHPGISCELTHQLIQSLRQQGHSASMDPGISTADCIFADLGLDPGLTGCIHLEAAQFVTYQYTLDPACLLVLWQLGALAGADLKPVAFANIQQGLAALTERLLTVYPQDHQVVIYEAASMAILPPRMEKIALANLPKYKPNIMSILVIPSCSQLEYNQSTLDRMKLAKS